MITYWPANGVYEKDGDKQIRADGQDKTHIYTYTHTTFHSKFRGIKQTKETETEI